MVQRHLSYEEMTEYGCFYTPQKFVDKLIEMIKLNVCGFENYTYLDSSCGYGNILRPLDSYKIIGCDIDPKAIDVAKRNLFNCDFYVINSLYNFNRKKINLADDEKLIIVGNPPYNDFTSKVKNNIKHDSPCLVDRDIKTRDLGLSFLLSFLKLNPEYVAILHPLSYMIKKTNFNILSAFYQKYKLIDHCIINSQEFSLTSRTKGFPIIIAIYKKVADGMKYTDIFNMTFKTIENKKFNLNFDYISNYIKKYPSKDKKYTDNDIFFFTMRDINALNRSKTFLKDFNDNAIVIDKNKFAYYCYVDVFKDYISKIPYYLGNCDVFINNEKFLKLKNIFITRCIEKYPWLKTKISYVANDDYNKIDQYFNELFCFNKEK